ncbi:MAG: zinc ribbon domain-containing protein [Spirochaetes bacterium]|nr:MAG: zinc ribbon domain-containing protein [Spirochaetota bacterium]
MPTYDYECTECGYTFEYFQSMSDDLLQECPKCGGKVKRLIGGGLGVIFKGSGFYVTDNKKSLSTPAPVKKNENIESAKSKSAEKGKPEKSTKTEKPKKETVAT